MERDEFPARQVTGSASTRPTSPRAATGTPRGQHRSAGTADLVVAATAEPQGLTLLHRDRDFECIAAVTGQALQWYGPEAGK